MISKVAATLARFVNSRLPDRRRCAYCGGRFERGEQPVVVYPADKDTLYHIECANYPRVAFLPDLSDSLIE